jgi:hypothetical protein
MHPTPHPARSFNPASAAFTLDSVVALRLDTAADFIAELAASAAKEASIEAGLASIAATWGALQLDMAEYKVGRGAARVVWGWAAAELPRWDGNALGASFVERLWGL